MFLYYSYVVNDADIEVSDTCVRNLRLSWLWPAPKILIRSINIFDQHYQRELWLAELITMDSGKVHGGKYKLYD